MATKIKLMRLGKMRAPYYRIVVADARTKRDGRVIETIGKYHPKEEPSLIEVDADRAAYWLGVGAQPTEPVQKLLSKTGDWQKFKGEAAPEPLKVAAPKADKKAVFEAAAKESMGDAAKEGATTARSKRPAKKAAAPVEVAESAPGAGEAPAKPAAKATPADAAPAKATPADAAPADAAPADAAPAETAPADAAPAETAPAEG